MSMKALLLGLVLCFFSSYSSAYEQQYQLGDTGPNGGVVTSVTVEELYVGEEVVQEGDFLEVTHSYEYTETIIEEVATEEYVTTTTVTPVTTPNLITDPLDGTQTNIYIVPETGNNYGMPGADFTTGNQQQGGGSIIYEGSLEAENKQKIEYGVTVYSHSSNTSVPECANTTGDCKDDFKVTVSLFNDGVLVDTMTHSYTGIDWSGSRDYSWSQDVSTLTFDYGTMELYGIDRGFYGGYYGPGFSDPFVRMTYNIIEQVVQKVVSYVEMETIKKTEEFVYESIYNPPPVEIISIDFEPITDTQFEVEVVAESLEIEVIEVFEVELDSIEAVSELEVAFENIESEVEEIQVEASIEDEVAEAEVETPEPTEEPQEPETEVAEVEPEPEAEEKPTQKPEAKPEKRSARYSMVLDSIKVALMVQNEANQVFASYQQETIPDVPFYDVPQIDGGTNYDNPNARFFTGASDILMDELVDMQWQR